MSVFANEDCLSFTANDSDNQGQRVDNFLTQELKKSEIKISRSKVKELIKTGNVYLANKNITINNPSYIVKINDNIILKVQDCTQDNSNKAPIAQNISFEIIFEDQDLAIINKPANLVTHPGSGTPDNTLVNGLLHRFKDQLSSANGIDRPGIIHRLDKDTTGLMIIAKNNNSHRILAQDIKSKNIIRKYKAFIYGVMDPKSGTVDKRVSRHKYNRLKMTTANLSGTSRSATTLYNTLETFYNGYASLIECELLTGRTHQIRVHAESEKHSIIGDKTYNSCKKQEVAGLIPQDSLSYIKSFPRQALHSYFLRFKHPRNDQYLEFYSELPQDLTTLHKCLS